MTRIVRLSQTEIEKEPASRMRLEHRLEALRERTEY